MSDLRIGSLCSGYEGLGMAVQGLLGGSLAWVADNDPGASKVLAHRFPDVPNLGDLTAVDWSAVEPVDVICAGFPCQDISYAGQGAGIQEGNRSGLWYVIADAIGVLRPRLVLLENVAAIIARRPGLDVVLASLAELGFDAEWTTLRASDIGACHGRNRWFAAAYPGCEPVQRRGIPGVLGGTERPAARDESQRQRDGHATAYRCDAAAEDTDRAACGERRIAAPGQAESGRPRADAGGSGGAPAADSECDRLRGSAGGPGEADARRPGPRPAAEGRCPGAYADAERGRRDGRPPDPERRPLERVAAARAGEGRGGGTAAAYPDSDGLARGEERDGWPQLAQAINEQRRVDPLGRVLDWGVYEPAIRRHEAVFGRPAPAPTEPGRGGKPRLSPRLNEWMMGLPEGWVTDVPGLSRNDMLRVLGNGVVPRCAAAAYSTLIPAWLQAVPAPAVRTPPRPILTLADVVDLDHNCITACCLAHHAEIFTGGIDRDWLHQSRHPCAEIPPGVPARAEPDPVAVRKPARPREQAARDPKTPERKPRPAAEVVHVAGDLL